MIASALDPDSLVASRANWAKLDWTRVDENALVRNLPDASPEDAAKDAGFKYGVAVKQGEAKLFGRDVKVSLRERSNAAGFRRGIFISAFERSSTAVCADVLGTLERGLGQPSISHDFSYTLLDGAVTSRRAQWTIGDTRLGFFCHVLSRNDRTDVAGVWQVHAWNKSVEPPDSGLKWIRCSLEFSGRVNGEDRKRPMPDAILAIDEYGNDLLGDSMMRFARTVDVTPTRVSYTEFEDGSPMRREGTINRRTGEIFETVTSSDVPDFKAFVRGSCSRFDRNKKAF